MLAFTMQFSSYGRKPSSLGASAPRELRPVPNALILQPPEGINPAGNDIIRAFAELTSAIAAASSGPNSVLGISAPRYSSFRSSPEGKNVLTGLRREEVPNNQCSTRKHGRPRRHSLRRDAGAP